MKLVVILFLCQLWEVNDVPEPFYFLKSTYSFIHLCKNPYWVVTFMCSIYKGGFFYSYIHSFALKQIFLGLLLFNKNCVGHCTFADGQDQHVLYNFICQLYLKKAGEQGDQPVRFSHGIYRQVINSSLWFLKYKFTTVFNVIKEYKL